MGVDGIGYAAHTLDMLSAYYFRAHLYTIVPHQVQEDFSWMADHGTDAVVIGVLEQDPFRCPREPRHPLR